MLAAGLLALAALYFIHGFFLWMTQILPGWAAALATGGLVLLVALATVMALLLVGRRRSPAPGPGAAIGVATASHLAGGLLRGLSPRMVAFGLGIVAALVLLLAERDRRGGGPDRGRP